MNLTKAYLLATAAEQAGAPGRVFDWIKAAHLIRERKPHMVWAGLGEDWSCTSGLIYTADGIPDVKDTYTYLSSIWATPQMQFDFGPDDKRDTQELIDCWRYQHDVPEWGSHTFWPDEALKLLTQT